MKKAAKGGVMVKLNGNQAVQKMAGSKGVGNTKSQKATKQTKAGGTSPGGVNKPQPKPGKKMK
jgi:hypothetical protein